MAGTNKVISKSEYDDTNVVTFNENSGDFSADIKIAIS